MGVSYLSNERAERSLIICLLADFLKIKEVMHVLPKEAFHNEIYLQIYTCMLEIAHSKSNALQMVDYSDVSRLFSIKYGQAETISDLLKGLIYEGMEIDFDSSYRKVVETYVRRLLVKAADAFQRQLAGTLELQQVVENLRKNTDSYLNMLPSNDSVLSNIRINERMIEEQTTQQCDESSVMTGLFNLDNLTGGLMRGHISVLASRVSMGKTSLLNNIIVNALRQNARVVVFSLETSVKYLVYRMVSIMSGVNYKLILHKQANDVAVKRVVDSLRTVRSYHESGNLVVFEHPGSMEMLLTTVRKMHSEAPLDVVAIDFLQLLSQANAGSKPMYLQINEIMTNLKQLAIQLNISILVLSQVNRAVESSEDKIPWLGSLSYSGSIETAADVVMFLHRESYYSKRKFNAQGVTNDGTDNVTDVLVSKNRNGPIGKIRLYFNASTGKFTPLLEGNDQ